MNYSTSLAEKHQTDPESIALTDLSLSSVTYALLQIPAKVAKNYCSLKARVLI